jgi:hypothetical protein
MPVVSDTLWRSPNLIPVAGQRYTLGWQDAKKDGPCFLLARTGVMGDKILDRFPLTQDGWAPGLVCSGKAGRWCRAGSGQGTSGLARY